MCDVPPLEVTSDCVVSFLPFSPRSRILDSGTEVTLKISLVWVFSYWPIRAISFITNQDWHLHLHELGSYTERKTGG